MSTSTKNITLRAFKIENDNLTTPHSGILSLLQTALANKVMTVDRLMPLNAEEPDRDLLANFTWATNNTYMFGMMLRIIPADRGGVIDDVLFSEKETITITDINTGNSNQSQYKSHYYFAIENNYVITSLPGNQNIYRLQTYINWLLQDVRGDRMFYLTELTKLPEGLSLRQIKSIQFTGDNRLSATPTDSSESTSISTKIMHITDDLLRYIMDDTNSLDDIRSNQLVEARLFLKIKKSKPKMMEQEEFQSVMGSVVTNIANDENLLIETRDGNKSTGDMIKVKKQVSIEQTEANRIVEEQLKQEMESFLREIEN